MSTMDPYNQYYQIQLDAINTSYHNRWAMRRGRFLRASACPFLHGLCLLHSAPAALPFAFCYLVYR